MSATFVVVTPHGSAVIAPIPSPFAKQDSGLISVLLGRFPRRVRRAEDLIEQDGDDGAERERGLENRS
jgi:hypothetical protein